MKTLLILLILVSMVFSFACSGSNNPTNPNPNPDPDPDPDPVSNQNIPGNFYSEIIDETYLTMLSLPDNYNANDPQGYHVVFVFDAEELFAIADASITTLSNLGTILPTILIGIRNPSMEARARDFTYPRRRAVDNNSGGGENYYQFLKTELLPFIDSAFNTQGQHGRTLIGWSLTAQYTLWNLFKYRPGSEPLLFKNYLPIAPGALNWAEDNIFTMEESMSQAINNNLPANIYITIGSTETDLMDYWLRMDSVLDLRNYNNYNYSDSIYPGLNHRSVRQPSITDGLEWFFGL